MIRSLVLLFALVVVGCANDDNAASSSADPMDRVNDSIANLPSIGIEPNEVPANFSLKHTAPNIPYGHVKLEYVAYETLLMDVLKDSRDKLLTKEEEDERLLAVPEGGLFKIKVYRKYEEGNIDTTKDSANTSNFKYVLLVDGKEVSRKDGEASEPVLLERIWFWENEDVIYLDQEFDKDSFVQLIVLDTSNNVQDEFEIAKKAEADSE